MTTIELRLNILEKQNRRMKHALVGTYLIFGLAITMGAALQAKQVAKEIKAKRFVVEDDAGKERIVMEVRKKKLSENPKDKRQGSFANIVILDPDGDERIVLDASDDGLSRCMVYGEDGDRRFEIVTSVDSFARFLHYDSKGRRVINRWP